MKAIVYENYGSPKVLQLKEVAKPEPQDNEILIRIRATAVNSGDLKLRKADPFAVRFFFGLFKPKKNILGIVLSGEIEKKGKHTTLYNTGDQVFGSAGMHFSTYAQYVCVSEEASLAVKPVAISHAEAAAIPFGGTTALHFIKKANIQPGQKVLIYGASGAVGTAAVQLAKYFGATVTAVCSTANAEMVKSLGADKVIDYTREDFTRNGETYDVIFETVNKLPYADSLKSLSKNGVLILGAAGLRGMINGAWTSMTGRANVLSGMINETAEDLAFLKGLLESGRIKAVIDRTYSLEEMTEAHAYVEKGHKKGNVVITIS